MPNRIAVSTLQASTIDILNTIRANATYEYQNQVPVVTTTRDIPRVGEILFGYPNLANEFINALINRIALVRIKSSVFNNPYRDLKKGYLEFGETVEEVFVNIAKAREFNVEKAAAREFRRTLPDVRAAFHAINWRVQYPVTIQDEDLRMAFTSINGVQDMIARIVDSVYQAAEYDEFLLVKYLLIKAVSHGKMYPVRIPAGPVTNSAVEFRTMSNLLTFMGTQYNQSGVTTVTPREDQYIFMDARFNAQFDVDVLSAAFNMDKANFMGRLFLIDNFTTFDNARFDEIRRNSDTIDEVTDEELALMADVKAIIVDREWFQLYDNLDKFSEKYVAAGMYWNYFYNQWKTISSSPFSNAVVFVTDTASTAAPTEITAEVQSVDIAEHATVINLVPQIDNATLSNTQYKFVQTAGAVQDGIAVHPYGAYMFPPNKTSVNVTMIMGGETYQGATPLTTSAAVGSTITLNKITRARLACPPPVDCKADSCDK